MLVVWESFVKFGGMDKIRKLTKLIKISRKRLLVAMLVATTSILIYFHYPREIKPISFSTITFVGGLTKYDENTINPCSFILDNNYVKTKVKLDGLYEKKCSFIRLSLPPDYSHYYFSVVYADNISTDFNLSNSQKTN